MSLPFNLQVVKSAAQQMCLCAEHFDAGESLVSVHLKVGVWEHTEEAAGECGRQCCDPRALAAV